MPPFSSPCSLKSYFIRLKGLCLLILLVFFSGFFLYYHTTERALSPAVIEVSAIEKLDEKNLMGSEAKEVDTRPPSNKASVTKTLISNPILQTFSEWLESFSHITCSTDPNCTQHDPRKIRHFLQSGEKLAIRRKALMQKLIREKPKLAIQYAVPQDLISALPHAIAQHIESWQNGLGDLSSVYRCKGNDHSGCVLSKYLTMQGGGDRCRGEVR